MRTVGIDLAAGLATTAASVIKWTEEGAVLFAPRLKCTDKDLLCLLQELGEDDRAGIDCPFGWPTEFVRAMAAHGGHQPWPGRGQGSAEYRARLRLRHTDLVVWEALRPGHPPLSVSFDKLGAAASRWAHLADALAARGRRVDRTGSGNIAEVYPRAARVRWGLDAQRSMADLLAAAPWLHCEDPVRDAYDRNEHAFDALIASLNVRAAYKGLTGLPPAEHADFAALEGWIHLPEIGSLTKLP
ncbi:DUF429 domain-containing protein [Kitasatospora sp. NBC_00240]|uniref:DUF429 domain-containing protein n=1 Tax=Kitasatospora sp. NBC_00240 TaxID=2903567 RepID=UPI0022518A4C|nr:DUF429 domain-containing protein [Kitasatospora sp. NBC_00240]MCX5215835.1 DUF429 domain-containing protein [Kitasatospora sp. NBC_00240]